LNIKKSLLVVGAVTTIGIGGIGGLGIASAASNPPPTGIADKIATKFNLSKDEVAKVFDEDQAAREAERQQKTEERLTQAVKDGKITEEQKQKILAKGAELRAERESMRKEMKGKTLAERQALKERRAHNSKDLRQWATDNNIPPQYLLFMKGMGHGPGTVDMPASDMEVHPQ